MREKVFESPPASVTFPPAVESFFVPVTEGSWLRLIETNPDFIHQIESRGRLNKTLDAVLADLPRAEMSLEEGISKGLLTEYLVEELYLDLATLLEDGRDYERIILYLPFEFLPATSWKPPSTKLQQAAQKFRSAYLAAWTHLLFVQDVRGNFVDGDVPEVAQKEIDPLRVVKAAHLIPRLVEKGILSVDHVYKLLETADDEILKQSIADALPVLADLGLIEAEPEPGATDKGDSDDEKAVIAPAIQEELQKEFTRIDAEAYPDVRKKRVIWLKQEEKRVALEATSQVIATAVMQERYTEQEIAQFESGETSLATQQAFIEGVRKALEAITTADATRGRTLYERYHPVLMTLWRQESSETKDALTKLFFRLRALKIVDTTQLRKLKLTLPSLAGPFAENLKAMHQDIEDVKIMIEAIEKNPELSTYIYPVVLVYGSRLKGYGTESADMDVAVFVKPGTEPAKGAKIRSLLKKTFAHKKIQGAAVEFWLEKQETGLAVRDDLDPTLPCIGDSSWTHVLFGAAWEGNAETAQKLREQLLVPYFSAEGKTVHGREARGLYLEELERDLLQYRLMHKGYERFFPPQGGLHTPHADRVDGKSMFWDSGYRRMATTLFARRVFLPKISKE